MQMRAEFLRALSHTLSHILQLLINDYAANLEGLKQASTLCWAFGCDYPLADVIKS